MTTAGTETARAAVTLPPAVAPELDETQRIPRLDATGAVVTRRPASRPVVPAISPSSGPTAGDDPADPAELTDQEKLVVDTVVDERSGVNGAPAPEQIARTGTEHPSPRPGGRTRSGKPGKPSMPSWDDVLLGSGVRKR